MLAVAFESLVKLAAFLIVGVYVTYVMFDGFGDLLRPGRAPGRRPAADRRGRWRRLCRLVPDHRPLRPRLPVPRPAVPGRGDRERRRERICARRAGCCRPICWPSTCSSCRSRSAGLLRGLGDGDLFVLLLPMASGHDWLALVAYLGGLSAASAMIIVATVALSTMISNDLVMPVLLRLRVLASASGAICRG